MFVSRRSQCLLLAVVGCATLTVARPATAQVLAPDTLIQGKTQSELSKDWFRWLATSALGGDALSPTNSLHPIMEVTGKQAFRGAQSGTPNVFFIGGSFSGITGISTVHRTASIAENTFLFFPLVSSGPSDNTNIPPDPPTTLTPDEMLNGGFGTDYITSLNSSSLFTEIDGVVASGLSTHRQTFGGAGFDVVYTNLDNLNSFFGYDVTLGTGILPSPVLSAADGYFVGVAPLAKGTHTLHFGSTTDFVGPDGSFQGTFSQDITYTITVGAPEPSSIGYLALLLPVVGLVRHRRQQKRQK